MNEMKLIDLGWCIGKIEIQEYGCKLFIVSPSLYAEDSYYVPATSIEIVSTEALENLRDALTDALRLNKRGDENA